MAEVRREVRERLEDKAALLQPRVWDFQLPGLHSERAVEQDVDVERSWSANRTRALASQRDFNPLSPREQHHREEVRFRFDYHVPELTLWREAHGLGFVDGGETLNDEVRRL